MYNDKDTEQQRANEIKVGLFDNSFPTTSGRLIDNDEFLLNDTPLHGNSEKLKCLECKKKLTLKGHLSTHLKAMHYNIKDYSWS